MADHPNPALTSASDSPVLPPSVASLRQPLKLGSVLSSTFMAGLATCQRKISQSYREYLQTCDLQTRLGPQHFPSSSPCPGSLSLASYVVEKTSRSSRVLSPCPWYQYVPLLPTCPPATDNQPPLLPKARPHPPLLPHSTGGHLSSSAGPFLSASKHSPPSPP